MHTSEDRNVARYFTEHPHVGWFLLVVALVLGAVSYALLPKRKDPFIRVRAAVAVCAWPGAPADRVEAELTRKLEARIAENADVEHVVSTSRTGLSIVTVYLRDDVPLDAIGRSFDDIELKLRAVPDLPLGALPVSFQKDFGDTAALMITFASPKVRPVETRVRAAAIEAALEQARRARGTGRRSALVLPVPLTLAPEALQRSVRALVRYAEDDGGLGEVNVASGPGFFLLDAAGEPAIWEEVLARFTSGEGTTAIHPDMWRHIVIDRPGTAAEKLSRAPGDAYTHRQLDAITERIADRLRGLPSVTKVSRSGVRAERVYLDVASERSAAIGVSPATLASVLAGRRTDAIAGTIGRHGPTIPIETRAGALGDTLVTTTTSGTPVFLRDVADVTRDYEDPPREMSTYTFATGGTWHRTRAITLTVQMHTHANAARLSEEVDGAFASILPTLPEDLVVGRTSDQARQVESKVGLFMTSLAEAVAIILVVALVGFREWRSALVLALSIPVTLALTFTAMFVLGIDVQQISIVALILALGLLVDDPVVAGDAIKHELDAGVPLRVAAWSGPTKLARAILYATVTNVVAYLPFLLTSGDVGRFIVSLPVVVTCSLVASRIVSMTFVPLLGLALLRPTPRGAPRSERMLHAMRRGLRWALAHRGLVLAGSLLVLVAGGVAATQLRHSFFPPDRAPLFLVDLYLPENAGIRETASTAAEADRVVRDVAVDLALASRRRNVLRSITTFVGAGAPRFWYSLAIEPLEPSHAQLVVEVVDERDTPLFVERAQAVLSRRVPGARIDVRQLENGKPVPRPIEVRLAGDDPATLRALGDRLKAIFEATPGAERVRDDWGARGFRTIVEIEPVKAGLSAVSSRDIALATAATSGIPVGTLVEGSRNIPIVARAALGGSREDRSERVEELYAAGVPIGHVGRVTFGTGDERIQRRDQRRTITVSCFPAAGALPSEVMRRADRALGALRADLPQGTTMEIGGAEEQVRKIERESLVIAAVSISAIFIALVLQFRHVLKPLLVFAVVPYGVAGALVAVVVTGSPFGYIAILATTSLAGIIVSHVIVLFEAIEERREGGFGLEAALLDATAARIRPVLITVGATVVGLVPLAVHGGPLWEPLCYAQIGGLAVATGITLLLAPVLYAVLVRDLGWLAWKDGP